MFLTQTAANPLGVSLNTYIKQKSIVYREMVSKRTEEGDGREITTENAKTEENYIRRRKELQFIMHMLLSGTVDLFAQRARSAEQRRTRL